MNNTGNVMKLVSPAKVLKQIADAIPEDCRENLIIIGSLAAGYHFFGEDANFMVRTKDADCLLSPRVKAIHAGVSITQGCFKKSFPFDQDRAHPGAAE